MAIGTLLSCDLFEDEWPTTEAEGVKTIVELPVSVKQKIVEQDSLMTELLNKVDTLTKELNSTKAENAELKKDIKSVLLYMDQLLENLPEEKIVEFAKSDEFTTYKKLFSELGLS